MTPTPPSHFIPLSLLSFVLTLLTRANFVIETQRPERARIFDILTDAIMYRGGSKGEREGLQDMKACICTMVSCCVYKMRKNRDSNMTVNNQIWLSIGQIRAFISFYQSAPWLKLRNALEALRIAQTCCIKYSRIGSLVFHKQMRWVTKVPILQSYCILQVVCYWTIEVVFS